MVQAPVTLELRNTPGKKYKQNQRWYAYITADAIQFMPQPETYKSEIGSQSTMCQVHTGAYVSLLAPGKTDYHTAHHPRAVNNIRETLMLKIQFICVTV